MVKVPNIGFVLELLIWNILHVPLKFCSNELLCL